MKRYTTKSGAVQLKPSIDELRECIDGANSTGWCLACGQTQEGVEPDARKYRCESCQALKVYGAEELMLMGLFHTTTEDEE